NVSKVRSSTAGIGNPAANPAEPGQMAVSTLAHELGAKSAADRPQNDHFRHFCWPGMAPGGPLYVGTRLALPGATCVAEGFVGVFVRSVEPRATELTIDPLRRAVGRPPKS